MLETVNGDSGGRCGLICSSCGSLGPKQCGGVLKVGIGDVRSHLYRYSMRYRGLYALGSGTLSEGGRSYSARTLVMEYISFTTYNLY